MGKTTTTKSSAEPFMCGIPLKPVEGDPLKDEQASIFINRIETIADSEQDRAHFGILKTAEHRSKN